MFFFETLCKGWSKRNCFHIFTILIKFLMNFKNILSLIYFRLSVTLSLSISLSVTLSLSLSPPLSLSLSHYPFYSLTSLIIYFWPSPFYYLPSLSFCLFTLSLNLSLCLFLLSPLSLTASLLSLLSLSLCLFLLSLLYLFSP